MKKELSEQECAVLVESLQAQAHFLEIMESMHQRGEIIFNDIPDNLITRSIRTGKEQSQKGLVILGASQLHDLFNDSFQLN